MTTARVMACALLTYGVALHTYTHLVEADSFSFGWWLWSLSPYIAGGLLFLLSRRPHATVGALLVPVLLDAANFYSVFIHPESSTAGLGMLFVPLWNLLVLAPIGAAIWLVDREASRHGSVQPLNVRGDLGGQDEKKCRSESCVDRRRQCSSSNQLVSFARRSRNACKLQSRGTKAHQRLGWNFNRNSRKGWQISGPEKRFWS